ncbi:MAG: hypothetical protein HETSPECPRED_008566 [Heterodermia speciosa]|uniref:Uncharacterized protein n=1 Tax=Heterodermia speciosa TaxID=116794 RepID=A0A8H3FY71_9LECA|nr:MAG: hypothetical protein HETSPECPRED_008566 [Heterodermia speciosa]
MSSTIVLITGGNRGLGQGLVKKFLELPNHTVIALNRDPSNPSSQALSSLPKGKDTTLIVIKYDASIEQDAFSAIQELQQKHAISYLDIVVPNAGFVRGHPLVKDVKRSDILDLFETNALGPVSLYQATRDLLQKSTKKPIFAPVGSGAGALGRQPPIPNASYGASKSVLFWYGVRIHAEDEWLNTFVLDPGFVQTDMGNKGAKAFGMEEAPVRVEDSVGGMFRVLTEGSRERYGGKCVLYTGEVQEW